MIKKEILLQYNALKNEINLLKAKIKELEQKEDYYTYDVVKGSSKSFPYIERTVKIYGIDQQYKERMMKTIRVKKDKLKALMLKCEEQEVEIYEFIEAIPDSSIRQVFLLRYIDSLTWLQIAFRISEHDEQVPRKKHDTYLKVYDKYEKERIK
jgi:hypothetical protein